MELAPRQAAFLAEEMQSIENAEDRYPSERRAAKRIREQAEGVLTE